MHNSVCWSPLSWTRQAPPHLAGSHLTRGGGWWVGACCPNKVSRISKVREAELGGWRAERLKHGFGRPTLLWFSDCDQKACSSCLHIHTLKDFTHAYSVTVGQAFRDVICSYALLTKKLLYLADVTKKPHFLLENIYSEGFLNTKFHFTCSLVSAPKLM